MQMLSLHQSARRRRRIGKMNGSNRVTKFDLKKKLWKEIIKRPEQA